MKEIIAGSIIAALILILLLALHLWRKKYLRSVPDNIVYIMYPSKLYLYVGIFLIVGYAIFTAFIYLISFDFVSMLFTLFPACGLLAGIYITICYVGRLVRYVITTDSFIVYIPLFAPKHIKIYEITTVRYIEGRGYLFFGKRILKGYHGKKKLFSLDDNIIGFDSLYSLFLQAGKIEQTEQTSQTEKIERAPLVENFSVTAASGEIIATVFAFLFFTGTYITLLVLADNQGEVFQYTLYYFLLMLILLPETMKTFVSRVKVTYRTISVRNAIGITKTYELSEITKVEEEKEHIILYAGSKKIAKIAKSRKNMNCLMARLTSITTDSDKF